MSIRLKILLGCLAMLVLTIGLGLFIRQKTRLIGSLTIQVYEQSLMGLSHVRAAQVDFIRAASAQRAADTAAMARQAAAGAAAEEPALSERQRLLRKLVGPLTPQPQPAALPAVVEELRRAVGEVLENLDVAIERASSEEIRTLGRELHDRIAGLEKVAAGTVQDTAASTAASTAANTAANTAAIDSAFNHLVEAMTADAFALRSAVDEVIVTSERSTLAALAASIALALVVTIVLGAMIARPVRRAADIAALIAEGKLDNQIDGRGRSEPARLLAALATMQQAIGQAHAQREADEQRAVAAISIF